MADTSALKQAGPWALDARLGSNGVVATYNGQRDDGQMAVVCVLDAKQLADLSLPARQSLSIRPLMGGAASRLCAPVDFGEADGIVYCAYERLRGAHLGLRVRDGGLPTAPRALEIAKQALEAIQVLHERGAVHGVITPASIFVNEIEQVKLLHSGWGRVLLGVKGGPAHPAFMSNLPFLAPEVAAGQEPDYPSDVFSLGANLYFLLTGAPPHWADDPSGLARLVATTPPDFSQLEAAVPEPIVQLLRELLDLDPDDRPLNLEALHERLDEYAGLLYQMMEDATAKAQGTGAGTAPPPPEDLPPTEMLESGIEPSQVDDGPPPIPRDASSISIPIGGMPPPAAAPPPAPMPDAAAAAPAAPAPAPAAKAPPKAAPPAKPAPAKRAADSGGSKKLVLFALAGVALLAVVGGGAFLALSMLGGGGDEPPPAAPTPRPVNVAQERAVLEPYIATIERMAAAAEANARFRRDRGRHPVAPAEIVDAGLAPDAESLADGWGTPLAFRQQWIFSAGPDGQWDTRDDMYIDTAEDLVAFQKPRTRLPAGDEAVQRLDALLAGFAAHLDEPFVPGGGAAD